ncbi:nickel ABC transporter substrate-binding protein [Desulforamulus ruminis]|uniref:nickel ABC transporter substrate-binding protein n=1 Tax=Desulforamulus ruminis TaxID=1564 RepID=UPI002FD9FA2C
MGIKRILVLSLLLSCIWLATGCGPGDENREKNQQNSGSGEVEELVTCESVDLGSMDIIGSNGQGFYYHFPAVYETLVTYQQGKIVPCLAEDWEVNENEYIFHLRKGVKFSDDSLFNAEVVKLNLEMIKKHGGDDTAWFGAIAKLEAVEVVDEYTVKLIYEKPYYAALQDLTSIYLTGMMSPKMYANGNVPYHKTTQPIGTGPYLLAEANPDKYYTFVRNENYWGEKPKARKYTVKIIPDLDARMLALRSGEVDFILGSNKISNNAYMQFASDENYGTKLSEERIKTRNILLNTSRGPLADVRVRKAMEHGTNKQEMVDTILYGLEEKADYLLNPRLPYCDVKVTPYEFDKKKAEELLDAAGWKKIEGKDIREKNGRPLTLQMIYRTDLASDEDIVQAFKGQMRDIGIDIKATGYEMMTWYSKGLSGEFDLTVNDTYGVPYDPHTYISPMTNYGADYPAQQGLTMKKELDQKIGRLFETVNEEELQDVFTYVLTTLHEEATNIPLSYSKEMVIYNKSKIKDVEFFGLSNLIDVKAIHFK